MNSIDRIPISKVERASNMVQTGAKVGVNYLKYYGKKLTSSEKEARTKLNQDNADDIYDGLKKLKESALKVAQMLSMEKSIMPQEPILNIVVLILSPCSALLRKSANKA